MYDNKRVLILQLSRMGDLLQSTLLINSLKSQGKTVFLLGDEKNSGISKEIDIIDKFIPFKIGKYIALIKNRQYNECFEELYEFISQLNKKKFSELYNLNHSEINYFIASLSNAPIKRGFKTENNNFIQFIYKTLLNRKENRFNLVDVFNFFSYNPVISKKLFINKNISEKKLKTVDKLFKNNKNIILHMGAGHPLREWGVENFAELSEKIFSEFNGTITLTGTKNERHIGKSFVKSINPSLKKRIINLIGKTDISLLKSVILKSELLISTDTGIMHLASACGIKVIALFYASAFVFETGPYTENALIIAPVADCYPCTETLQFCKDIFCKKLIRTDDVLFAFRYMINTAPVTQLKKYFSKRKNVKLFTPYFDSFGICYNDILNNEKFEKIREKGFGYAKSKPKTFK